MSNRIDQEREKELQPKRMEYAVKKLNELGVATQSDNTRIAFQHKGEWVFFFPYSGWHSGKTIKDGRGLEHLLKQIENKQ